MVSFKRDKRGQKEKRKEINTFSMWQLARKTKDSLITYSMRLFSTTLFILTKIKYIKINLTKMRESQIADAMYQQKIR